MISELPQLVLQACCAVQTPMQQESGIELKLAVTTYSIL